MSGIYIYITSNYNLIRSSRTLDIENRSRRRIILSSFDEETNNIFARSRDTYIHKFRNRIFVN